MLIDNEMKYLQKNDGDHREWYISLGKDPNDFENIVRGFILDGKIVFYKGLNFNYDEEVIKVAQQYAPSMRLVLGNPNLEVWCGALVESFGAKWEPILRINDDELTGFIEEKPVEKVVKKEVDKDKGPVLEFVNDYNDERFIKNAVKVTEIILGLAILSKIVLIICGKLYLNTFGGFILCVGQIGVLGYLIYAYPKKNKYIKPLSILACFFLAMSFSFFDIILAIIYFLFSVDSHYLTKIMEFVTSLINKIRGNIK